MFSAVFFILTLSPIKRSVGILIRCIGRQTFNVVKNVHKYIPGLNKSLDLAFPNFTYPVGKGDDTRKRESYYDEAKECLDGPKERATKS